MNPSPHDQMIPDDFVTPYLLSHLRPGSGADYPPRRSRDAVVYPSLPGYIIIL